MKHLKKVIIEREMADIVQSIKSECEICYRNNPNMSKKVVLEITEAGDFPGDYWQIDSAELPSKEEYRHVLVDTFSGWSEVYPCHTNTAKEVAKVLLSHIIPRSGVPKPTLLSHSCLLDIAVTHQGRGCF